MSNRQAQILVVDDSAIERLKLKSYFEKRDFIIIEAHNGAEAVELFNRARPDLILMDVNMPIMDGFEATEKIRAIEKDLITPIMMLTADDDMESIEKAFEVGANHFFRKPINYPLLHQRIRYGLREAARETELRRVTSLQEAARTLAGLAFWEFDIHSREIIWSGEAATILHWLDVLPNTIDNAMVLFYPEDSRRLSSIFADAFQTGLKFDVELRSPGKEQEYLLKIVGQREDRTHRIIGALQDVTAQRRLEHQAEFLNFHDGVTGLPNRRLFQRDLQDALKTTSSKPHQVVVIVIEVLRFQLISETYGTEMAEQLLHLLANQLKANLPTNALLARLDGGTFAARLSLIDRHSQTLDELHLSLMRWIKVIDRPWMLGEREIFLTYAVGFSRGTTGQDDADSLVRMAHQALRSVKPTGNITVGFNRSEEESGLQKRLKLESDLRQAFDNEAFELVYQPQLDLNTNRIVGVEALIRWHHPQEGAIPPFIFIPILEEIGLISALGEFILRRACQAQVAWRKAGLSLRMGINLSPAQFEQTNLSSRIMTIASESGANPQEIELEITESLAMHNPEQTIAILEQLRTAGFKIAIDDFGIGFSSLEYLLRFPLDTLKIDRAFVKDITLGRRNREIVRALTTLCQGIGLTTIAEGIETQRQKDYVDALGATEIQGYLISKPLKGDDLVEFVRQFHTSDLTHAKE